MLIARPLDLLATISRPAVWLLGRATDVVVRLLGGDPRLGQATPEELRELVAGHRGLTVEQRMSIIGALEINGRALREVVVPRRSVLMLEADMPVEKARTTLANSGHTRAPVVDARNLDGVVGVVHLRDLLGENHLVADAARPVV